MKKIRFHRLVAAELILKLPGLPNSRETTGYAFHVSTLPGKTFAVARALRMNNIGETRAEKNEWRAYDVESGLAIGDLHRTRTEAVENNIARLSAMGKEAHEEKVRMRLLKRNTKLLGGEA